MFKSTNFMIEIQMCNIECIVLQKNFASFAENKNGLKRKKDE